MSDIWSVEKKHKQDASLLQEIKQDIGKMEQRNVVIDESNVNNQCKKVSNWKASGHDGVQGFWIKRFSKLHSRIASQLNEMLEGNEEKPPWMTYGRTVLCQNDVSKGTAVDNFRPITCLPLMWKLMTGIISGEMYCFLESENLLFVKIIFLTRSKI